MRRAAGRRAAGWIVVLGLASAPWWMRSTRGARDEPASLFQRLAGPLASLVAGVQWARADEAMRRDSIEVALARAELALLLDPGSTGGWNLLANYLGLDLASPLREPDPAHRRVYLEAALAVLERGVQTAREPAELEFLAGLLLSSTALRDPTFDWPGGPRAMWTEAAQAFDRAAHRGHPEAAEMAAGARRAARDF